MQRARETAGISRTEAARRLRVDTVTYYRWELGQRVPTHGANLGNFARFAKRIGVDEDPAMCNNADTADGGRGVSVQEAA